MDVSVTRSVSGAIMLQNILTFHKLRQEMNDRVRIIICRDQITYDDIVVKSYSIVQYEDYFEQPIARLDEDDICICKFTKPVCISKRGLNSYLVSAYISMLSKSHFYRKNAMRVLKHFRSITCDRPFDVDHSQTILIRLRAPRKQFLDYKWQVLQ